jgi:hypothetical protein
LPEVTQLVGLHKDDVIKELFKLHNGRALYNQKSLARIGQMQAADWGVFGWVERLHGRILLSCELTHLATGEKSCGAQLEVPDEGLIGQASVYLADQLIAQQCEIHILGPKSHSRCARRLAISGDLKWRPDTWSLWLFVEPRESDGKYPQVSVTEVKNGLWQAMAMIGDGSNRGIGEVFHVYPMLVCQRRSRQITEYLRDIRTDMSRNVGLNMSEWKNLREYKIFPGVVVKRSARFDNPTRVAGR